MGEAIQKCKALTQERAERARQNWDVNNYGPKVEEA